MSLIKTGKPRHDKRLKHYCCDCGVRIGRKDRFRCWECDCKQRSKRHSGENNPFWEGGKSYELYPMGWNKTCKEQIRRRDEYKCQLCGVPEVESSFRLHVHHIDYDKKNLSPENLISLCQSCHMKTNFRREEWVQKFKQL